MKEYKTIPKRDVFLERLMKDISDNQKDFIELLIDCNEWYEEENGKELISRTQLQIVSIFLHRRYTKTQDWIEAELDEYNKAVNLGAKII